jgi:hypothetical protein
MRTEIDEKSTRKSVGERDLFGSVMGYVSKLGGSALLRAKANHALFWMRNTRHTATLFSGTPGEIVALHLVRRSTHSELLDLLYLQVEPRSPELDMFVDDLSVRWSLRPTVVQVDKRSEGTCRHWWHDQKIIETVSSRAITAGIQVIATARRRFERDGCANPPPTRQLRLQWLDPIWWFTDHDVARYVAEHDLPLPRPAKDAGSPKRLIGSQRPMLSPEIVDRMRGLGYF